MSEQQLVQKVFLSHCSAQRDFVLYLGARLKANGLQYFSSAESEHGCDHGRPFDESLLRHVRAARVVVLVLSQQFFSSKWCMKELAESLQVQHPDKVLLPVFYGWQQPGDVRRWLQQQEPQHLLQLFQQWTGQHLLQQQEQQHLHQLCKQWTGQDLLQLWDAISRWHGEVFTPGGSNPDLAERVLQRVRQYINFLLFPEQQVVAASEWVDWGISRLLQQNGRLGVCGLGGKGKTTLAELMYNRLYELFDGRVAFIKVGQQPSEQDILKLQWDVLRQVLKLQTEQPNFTVPGLGAQALTQRLLPAPRFLIVLDDLWEDVKQPDLLQWLLPPAVAAACRAAGSWVVVTTRSSSTVTSVLGPGTACEVPDLGVDAEWELLTLHAGNAVDDLSDTDRQLLLRSGCHLPLKLKLLGCQLLAAPSGSANHRAMLSGLAKLLTPAAVSAGLDAAFISSYEALPSMQLRLAFLDIGMFMTPRRKQDVANWCDAIHGQQAEDIVSVLESRALVIWAGGDNDEVFMHDALREFVERYVQESTATPNRRREEIALFWKEEDEPLVWPASSASVALQRLVAIKCADMSVVVHSLPGHPAAAAAAAAALRQQPQLDSLVVLVLTYGSSRPLASTVIAPHPPTPAAPSLIPHAQQLWLHDLSHLRFVDLRFCEFVELHLRSLPSLRVLLISGVSLYKWKDWAEQVRALRQLQHLQAGLCFLQGELPNSWSELTCLRELDLHHNSFKGQLPPSWSALAKLTHLSLNCCSLQGPLPSNWAALMNLRRLDLGYNRLEMQLPEQWSELTGLQELDLHYNRLCGSLPSTWSNLRSLQKIDMSQNMLSGSLPPDWSALQSLLHLGLGNNQLSGQLPPQWSALHNLERLWLSNNQLTGHKPEEWSTLRRLTTLSLHNNRLFEVMPSRAYSRRMGNQYEEDLIITDYAMGRRYEAVLDHVELSSNQLAADDERLEGLLNWFRVHESLVVSHTGPDQKLFTPTAEPEAGSGSLHTTFVAELRHLQKQALTQLPKLEQVDGLPQLQPALTLANISCAIAPAASAPAPAAAAAADRKQAAQASMLSSVGGSGQPSNVTLDAA